MIEQRTAVTGGAVPHVMTFVLLGGAMVVAAIASTFAWLGVARRAWGEEVRMPGVGRAVDDVASRSESVVESLRSFFLAPPFDLVPGLVGGLAALAVVLARVVVGRLTEDAFEVGRPTTNDPVGATRSP